MEVLAISTKYKNYFWQIWH